MLIVNKLLFLLSKREKKKAFYLLLMILVMAFLDMIGVASIVPFITILANPDFVETNPILKSIFETSSIFGVENKQQFFYFIGIFVFILLFTSLAFKALTTYATVRFVRMTDYRLSKRMVEVYLKQPYSWFLNQHSADLGKNILSEVGQVVGGGINPLLELIAKSTISIVLIALLVFNDPKLAFSVGFFLSFNYFIIYKFVKKLLNKIGKERLFNNELRFKSINEAFSATKEIKISGLEHAYIDRFSIPSKIFAKVQSLASVIIQLPRFFLEAIAFGGIILLLLFLMKHTGSLNNALPIISLYVFAGYRLLPALQQIYGSFTELTFVGPTLDKLYNDLKNFSKDDFDGDNKDVLPLFHSINLDNINYSYPNSSKVALKNINIQIPAKTTVGLIGTTGSGKTTTLDILLGLLKPDNGSLKIDGNIITKNNRRLWQNSIGYVPQNIYLSDDTIEANIAFGINPININKEDIERAAKIANLHDFIINELPNKYKTKIGERGIRLSGGQRQRIGIARALYHNPKVLVLDEATNSLDSLTEKLVMSSINNISKDITTIIVAHRLNTVRNCNTIFKLEKGRLVSKGSYQDLIENGEINQENS